MKPLADHLWMNGRIVPWASGTVHVTAHALHYGTSVFEGIRVYDTPDGPCGFRVTDHIVRLFDSARMYGIALPYSVEELVDGCKAVVRRNKLSSAYIRPIAYLGECGMGVTPVDEQMEVDVAIAAFPWGAYLGDEGQKFGVDVCVSSWARLAPNTVPTGAKAGGNYLSSYLIGREARNHGYVEGIGLSTDGRLSEGAGENLFLVKDGRILTPPAAASILVGITRDTVLKLASAEGIEIVEQVLPREALYVADEVFLTGTAAEITPVRSVDRIATKCNGPGPVTRLLQKRFFGLFDGSTEDRYGWLEPMRSVESSRAVAAA